jgi:hypothetical protein
LRVKPPVLFERGRFGVHAFSRGFELCFIIFINRGGVAVSLYTRNEELLGSEDGLA